LADLVGPERKSNRGREGGVGVRWAHEAVIPTQIGARFRGRVLTPGPHRSERRGIAGAL
jgi:hypothetical protein